MRTKNFYREGNPTGYWACASRSPNRVYGVVLAYREPDTCDNTAQYRASRRLVRRHLAAHHCHGTPSHLRAYRRVCQRADARNPLCSWPKRSTRSMPVTGTPSSASGNPGSSKEKRKQNFSSGTTISGSPPGEDDPATERMEALVRSAAAKDHADALWFLASRLEYSQEETTPESERLLLRAGELGSLNAQACLGNLYATGDSSVPIDLAKSVAWYRRAAERGERVSQYELGFNLLLGEGGPKNIDEGLMWLERAADLGNNGACKLLADCYGNGSFDVPLDAAKAARWRDRLAEYERLHPPSPHVHYSLEDVVSPSSIALLLAIEGVTGFGYIEGDRAINVSFDSALITPAELDEKVRAVGNRYYTHD